MGQLLEQYTLDGKRHRIEMVQGPHGGLVLDHPPDGPALVVAELEPGEGREQALAVLGSGRYLERALAGETGLGRTLGRIPTDHGGRDAPARAA